MGKEFDSFLKRTELGEIYRMNFIEIKTEVNLSVFISAEDIFSIDINPKNQSVTVRFKPNFEHTGSIRYSGVTNCEEIVTQIRAIKTWNKS